MTLRLNGNERIHNIRDYPAETVAGLRTALGAGALAEPDPHRRAFYEVTSGARRYYIHVAPDGSVWLLASWVNLPPAPADSAAVLSACC